ncbi:efflux RND transporter periplasmic adaptor subunit [Ornatilinea apprima]|uniref:efflux RND transporter periplasmic adaptor subunit n=1 Tax=Ornatilinea apprima TaxID=1134406 RepID=UPI001364A125|nr:efflux RND transporter periplasmic adaptor subunit [Ornatilinea apprima]
MTLLVVASALAFFKPAVGAVATATAEAAATPKYYTASVSVGDIELSASGSGNLISNSVVELAFSTSGTVTRLYVQPGDMVKTGDLLAELNASKELQAEVASRKLAVIEAQQALNQLQQNAEVSLASAFEAYVTAKADYEEALFNSQRTAYSRCDQQTTTRLAQTLERATEQLKKLTDTTTEEYTEAKNNYETASANYTYCVSYSEDEKTLANAALSVAEATLKQAEATYNKLKEASGVDPEELALAEANLSNAQSKLEIAQENLNGTTLIAPMDGTVISIAAGEGQRVEATTFITIADLKDLMMEVSVDESDLSFLTPGTHAEMEFDSIANTVFSGSVIQVDPTLSESMEYKLATGKIRMDIENNPAAEQLLLGLNASVTLIKERAENALLVPLEAVRDLGNGNTAVFVVGADGNLTFRAVEVGITTETQAQILSGLQEGDTVSTGLVSTNS